MLKKGDPHALGQKLRRPKYGEERRRWMIVVVLVI